MIIPVRDGGRHLPEVLAALADEAPDEMLVVDSGSRDGSVALAREAGARVLEIGPEEFGHGRTRNLAAEAATGDLLLFLTQDATPRPGWLAAYARAFAADPALGAAFGPQEPRPDTSPMVASELADLWARFASGWAPVWLSNANAAYRRECWAEVRFRDVRTAEDQAFAHDLERTGWGRRFVPGARVSHAHDYSWAGWLRRAWEEGAGLRTATAERPPVAPRARARAVVARVRADRAQGVNPARSFAHHAGRAAAGVLGGRVGGEEPVPALPHAAWTRVLSDGPAPRRPPLTGQDADAPLHVAALVPPIREGSGGHATLFRILAGLEARGHTCSAWVVDPEGRLAGVGPGLLRARIREWYAPFAGPVFASLEDWYGADVVLATGWETAHPALALPAARARAYLVQDHEPEFHPTGAERLIAEDSYRHGMLCLAASPWLRDLLTERYGAPAEAFTLGIDPVYAPVGVARRRDTVIAYARHVTARRAVPLALLALAELKARRPDVRIVLFGDREASPLPFSVEQLGVATPAALARAYSEATVGLCLSTTNISLVGGEMLACGLPCVELAGVAAESTGAPLALVAPEPVAVANALETLLFSRKRWDEVSRAGRAWAAGRTWERAAEEVEAGLRRALGEGLGGPTA